MATTDKDPSQQTEFKLVSVVIESERLQTSGSTPGIEVRQITSDFEIYEHIDKPYLTARLLIVDTDNLLQDVDFLGGERITFTIKSPKKESKPFTNTFYVTKITDSDKINNNAQSIVFHLIEDIGYFSNLQFVNRSYSGRIPDIISKICFNFLDGKELNFTDEDYEQIKVIVPNLDPIDAMLWLTKKAKTKEGYPFYLYSTLVKDKLQFHDLGTMLTQQVLNPTTPFISSSAAISSIDPNVRRKAILDHKFSEVADLFTLIQQGLIGSKYEFIDTLKEKRNNFHYDIIADLFKPLIDASILKDRQKNPPMSPKFKFNEIPFQEHDATFTSVIGGSNQYRYTDENDFELGYSEQRQLSDYKARVIGKSMDQILRIEPLTMVVDGLDFIDGDKHSTIGNRINIEFPQTKMDEVSNTIDKRKSGDYLIFASRFFFKKERFDLALTCVKLGNMKRNS